MDGVPSKKTKSKLKYFLKRMGWKETNIQKTFIELKKFINNPV